MSSEEKITPEEFDQELERLMSSEGGTKKKKGGKKRKIILIAAAALVAGAIGFNALAGAR